MQTPEPEPETSGNNTLDPQRWVSNYADYLYAYARFRINDQDMARDLVQETFLAALERREKFQGKSTEKTWLTAILKNKIVDAYRAKSIVVSNGLAATHTEDTATDFFDPIDGHWNKQHRPVQLGIEHPNALENKEFESIFLACMKKLPALWFSVFAMKHMEDETTEMICSELKLSESNFWVIIHRAKINLRSCIQKNWI